MDLNEFRKDFDCGGCEFLNIEIEDQRTSGHGPMGTVASTGDVVAYGYCEYHFKDVSDFVCPLHRAEDEIEIVISEAMALQHKLSLQKVTGTEADNYIKAIQKAFRGEL